MMQKEPLQAPDLTPWLGRTRSITEALDVRQARLMQATLNAVPDVDVGDPLPALWHWAYFLEGTRLVDLGRDGHPKLGSFMPPVPLPRRMWAGSKVEFHAPLLIGETITKTSTIDAIEHKQGRSGDLWFVTVRHDLRDEKDNLRLTDQHTIVYREEPKPSGATAPEGEAIPIPQNASKHMPDTVTLFRYSALTFNGHRIHYDRDYARDVEGYPGLVFHGPLTATLLAAEAQKYAGAKLMQEFTFRAISPLFDINPIYITCEPSKTDEQTFEIIALNHLGQTSMKATARFE